MKRIILELGVRYRPTEFNAAKDHDAKLAMLISDLSDADPGLLEYAARKWVRESPFMPKLSELLKLMDEQRERTRPKVVPIRPVKIEAEIEPPIERIPLAELRTYTRACLDMGRSKDWISQEDYDAVLFQRDPAA